MCGGGAEWKDSRGIPRYSERSRDFFNRKYARADAATAKLAAFDTAAAETQTPEYHSGRETAFKDEYGDDFQKEYDAALNAISEGFIRRGIYNQKDYDTQKGALDKPTRVLKSIETGLGVISDGLTGTNSKKVAMRLEEAKADKKLKDFSAQITVISKKLKQKLGTQRKSSRKTIRKIGSGPARSKTKRKKTAKKKSKKKVTRKRRR